MANISKRKAQKLNLTKKTIMPYDMRSYTKPCVHWRTRQSKSTTHHTTLQWQVGNLSCHIVTEDIASASVSAAKFSAMVSASLTPLM